MCGIAGLWLTDSREPLHAATLEMLSALSHRGPDDEGIWVDREEGIAFGHRRLAVIDLSPAAHQPMVSAETGTVLTYNGEIYNYQELRRDLEAAGASFRSASDTEVLLRGYEQWGPAVVERAVGMFAFALWDPQHGRLLLARDRVGEKPLYYATTPRGLAFASEIGALRRLPWLDTTLDSEAVSLYLALQYVPAPLSIYRGVRKLPPGCTMMVEKGKVTVRRYWDPLTLAMGPRLRLKEEEALERLGELLRQAVSGQMTSDVPLGAFLSGGIDSSTVVSLMVETGKSRVRTFTIGFEDAKYDEAGYARLIARHLGTEHTEERLTEHGVLELIPRLGCMYGEPFADSSALPTHLVSTLAKRRVTVSLSGDGGDEAFGGYQRYAWITPLGVAARALQPMKGSAARLSRYLPGRWGRLCQLAGLSENDVYRRLVSIFAPAEAQMLTGHKPTYAEFDRVWHAHSPVTLRRKAMLADLCTYLPEDILAKVDRASMAVSLESRAPLLDHRVLEFALQLPDHLVRDKYLLKRFAYSRVPRGLLDRPKQGFAVPMAKWLRGELRPLLSDLVTPTNLAELGITDCSRVETLLRQHLSGEANHSGQVWALLALCLWHEGVGK